MPRPRYRQSAKRRLLDPFCCAGGAAKGYQRAGFENQRGNVEEMGT